MTKEERFNYLFRRLTQNELTEQELKEFWVLVKADTGGKQLDRLLVHFWEESKWDKHDEEYTVKDGLLSDIRERICIYENTDYNNHSKRSWIRVAAIVLFALGLVEVFFSENKKEQKKQQTAYHKKDIPPGRNGAVLQLANGTRIILDSFSNGNVAVQQGVSITKNGAAISYKQIRAKADIVEYNTITVPRARQFCVILPDGTRAYLNASSSLKYPTAFVDKERIVELKGEGYFEVAKDPLKPFHVVTAKGVDIRVLGTHFDVNAYSDEPFIRTTLAEGSVRVSVTGKSIKDVVQIHTIIPGQQAVLDTLSGFLTVKKVNVDNAVAWKNGYISLNGLHIHELMREIARWYDVNIQYTGKLSNDDFAGRISREEDLQKVLEILEKTGTVHFMIEGKNVLVKP